MVRTTRLKVSSAMIVVALTASLAACGDDKDDSGKDSGKTKIVYGLPTTTYDITTVGIVYAKEQGYFDKEGIDVEVKPLQDPIRALLSGDVDIAQTGADTAALALEQSVPIKAISEPSPAQAGVALGGPDVHSLQDLVGKNYAISAPGSSTATALTAELTAEGIDPASVNQIAVGSPGDRIKALLAGKVDGTGATILAIPAALDAVADGKLNVIAKDADYFPGLALSVDTVTENYLKANHDLLVKFLTAEMQGYRWAAANPDEAAKIAAKYVEDTPEDVLSNAVQQMSDIGALGTEPITDDSISKLLAALVSRKTIEADSLKPEDYADTSLSQEAAKNANP
jgi:ABC-type nitrate/sulfonate/bicarbonate transport system substrate-binding protein